MLELYKRLSEHKKFLEEQGYDVIYIGLYGSQNYNLDDENSDIDSKAIVVPKIDLLLRKKDLSVVYDVENGQIDVKDALSFYDVVRKGNPAFLEVIYSDYFIGDKEFRKLLQSIKPHPQAMIGMMRQKREALENRLPNSYPLMDKYGYDPKQYHHILRLYDALENMIYTDDDSDFIIKYKGAKRLEMLENKREPNLTVEETIESSTALITKAENMYRDHKYDARDISEEVYHFIKQRTIATLIKTSDLDYSVDQHRTFGQNIPKRDKVLFPQLASLEKFDISYTIYSYLEILDWGVPFEVKGDHDEDL